MTLAQLLLSRAHNARKNYFVHMPITYKKVCRLDANLALIQAIIPQLKQNLSSLVSLIGEEVQ
jgi:hypothetical protein